MNRDAQISSIRPSKTLLKLRLQREEQHLQAAEGPVLREEGQLRQMQVTTALNNHSVWHIDKTLPDSEPHP